MSKTKNEERLETLNRRLDEISQKQLQNIEKNPIEIEQKNTPPITNNKHKKNKLKTYLIRVSIIIVGFLILKNLNLSTLINSSVNEEPKIIEKLQIPEIKDENLKYNFSFQNEECIIVFGEFQDENEAIKYKKSLSQKFIEFPINHFFLPNQSNSKQEVYKIYLGPIKGISRANQWSKQIDQENTILEF